MEQHNKPKKNHWTQTKIDTATKKINQDIYGKNIMKVIVNYLTLRKKYSIIKQ